MEHNTALQILPNNCIQGLVDKESSSYENEDYSEEIKSISPKTSPSKASDLSSIDDCSEEINSSYERTENECSDYNVQSEDESDSQSEASWEQVLRCPNCDEEFDDKQTLLEHLQMYVGKVKPCANCSTPFNNATAYKFHRQLNLCSKVNKMYKCKLCNMIVCGAIQYNYHMSAHKRNQCKTCGEHFSNRKHLVAHTLNIHKTSLTKDSFKCHLCEQSFSQRRSLAYHYKLSHPSCHVCSTCLDMFDSDSDLLDHVKTHKTQTFICERCSKQFKRRQQYLVHLNEHEKYQCLKCNDGFSSRQEAVKHSATTTHQVTGIDLLQCAECGELFCSRALLTRHEATHGEKVYNCQKCKLSFHHERNYKNHLISNKHLHGEEPTDILACTECNKTFTNKNNLRVHIYRMHKTTTENVCTYCSYKTTSTFNLKRHMTLHTEKPQFICDKCGAKFQMKNWLQEHIIIKHSDIKNFSCEKCGKSFSRSSDLNRHLTNVHSETTFACHCGIKYKTAQNLNKHQFMAHGKVVTKQKRLKKLFPVENDKPTTNKKVKKVKEKKKNKQNKNCTEDMQLLPEPIPAMSSEIVETDVMMTERHPQEFLQIFNMDFTGVDKSQVVYTQNIDNLDMSGLHVVESLIQMDEDPIKQGTSVLINVRNLFGRPLTNDFLLEAPLHNSIVHGLNTTMTEDSQHIDITEHLGHAKTDVASMQNLQDYMIPNDLNFLNV